MYYGIIDGLVIDGNLLDLVGMHEGAELAEHSLEENDYSRELEAAGSRACACTGEHKSYEYEFRKI